MKQRALWILGVFSSLAYVSPASAASVQCSDEFGHCSVSNEGGDFMSCSCGDPDEGSSTAGTGGSDWEGLTEAELEEICLDELRFCNFEPQPVEGTTCSTAQATCTISNDPIDFISCDCIGDEGGFGGTGGQDWAGLDDAQLMDVCLAHASSACTYSDTDEETSESGSDTDGVPSTTGWGGNDTGDEGGYDTDGVPSTTGANDTRPGSEDADDGGEGFDTDGHSGDPDCGGVESGVGGSAADSDDAGGEAGGDSAGGESTSEDGGDIDTSPGEGDTGGIPVPPYSLCTVAPDGARGSGWMVGLLGLAGFLRRRRRA